MRKRRSFEKKESESKPDRGVVYVATRGINQNAETILTYRRRVLVPKRVFDEGKNYWPGGGDE